MCGYVPGSFSAVLFQEKVDVDVESGGGGERRVLLEIQTYNTKTAILGETDRV